MAILKGIEKMDTKELDFLSVKELAEKLRLSRSMVYD